MFTICFSINPARDFSEWMARVDDTENRGRSINQGKSQINAYIKDRRKAFELDVSEMPIIDKMEDEHQDSYYTTYLQPEDIEVSEEFQLAAIIAIVVKPGS